MFTAVDFRGDGLWIAGRKRGGQWKWTGRVEDAVKTNRWASRQPDGDGECMETLGDDGFNDGPCWWTHRGYICEQDAAC